MNVIDVPGGNVHIRLLNDKVIYFEDGRCVARDKSHDDGVVAEWIETGAGKGILRSIDEDG